MVVTPETNGQRIIKRAGQLAGNIVAPIRVPLKAAYNWFTSPAGTNLHNHSAKAFRDRDSWDLGERYLGLQNGGIL